MVNNRYSLAGWLAIAQAAIFPLAFVLSIIQGIIGISMFGYHGPIFGPGDLLFILFTVLSVYVLIMFRHLLNDRYSFHEIDILITIAILWNILFQFGSLAIRGTMIVLAPRPEILVTVLNVAFMSIAMLTAGIIDILIAIKLLNIKDRLNDLIKAFAYITLAAGILEASVILSPLALILIPVSCAILGMIFLREKEEVEFV
ncbi:MAG: hypothetical protein JSV44_11910 [Candidatus Zixiibacteriota bacterium]|nr:MAG: hypothetical protein JSV44_11910 [candidate division Zixibacteria bacterium]